LNFNLCSEWQYDKDYGFLKCSGCVRHHNEPVGLFLLGESRKKISYKEVSMIAYFVHNKKEQVDVIVIPDLGCRVPVDAERLQAFIAVSPDFKKWSGDACGHMAAQDFGSILATRDDCGDVNVVDEKLWRERMTHYLGG
jgi:hypothetical protein